MAAIVQRITTNKGGSSIDDVSGLFSEDELKQLQKISEDIHKNEPKK